MHIQQLFFTSNEHTQNAEARHAREHGPLRFRLKKMLRCPQVPALSLPTPTINVLSHFSTILLTQCNYTPTTLRSFITVHYLFLCAAT